MENNKSCSEVRKDRKTLHTQKHKPYLSKIVKKYDAGQLNTHILSIHTLQDKTKGKRYNNFRAKQRLAALAQSKIKTKNIC